MHLGQRRLAQLSPGQAAYRQGGAHLLDAASPRRCSPAELYCELVQHRAKRDGVRFFVSVSIWLDPRVESCSLQGSIGLGIILIVVTHVSAKSYDGTGKIKPFRVTNAAGSVHFGNKADRGIAS
jgi:hypothetical protein